MRDRGARPERVRGASSARPCRPTATRCPTRCRTHWPTPCARAPSTPAVARPDGPGHWLVDLVAANRQQLVAERPARRAHLRQRRHDRRRRDFFSDRAQRPCGTVRPAGPARRLRPVTAAGGAVAWAGPDGRATHPAMPPPDQFRYDGFAIDPARLGRDLPLRDRRTTPSPSASPSRPGATGTIRPSGPPCASSTCWPASRTTRRRPPPVHRAGRLPTTPRGAGLPHRTTTSTVWPSSPTATASTCAVCACRGPEAGQRRAGALRPRARAGPSSPSAAASTPS